MQLNPLSAGYWRARESDRNEIRQLDPKAVINFICIRDSYRIASKWQDDTRDEKGNHASCGDGTGTCVFTDLSHGLQWSKPPSSAKKFWSSRDANDVCSKSVIGGNTGWRLPSQVEVIQAIQNGFKNLSLSSNFFFDADTHMTYVVDDDEQMFKEKERDLLGENDPNDYTDLVCVREPNAATCVNDEDCDGVPDSEDQCPHTPKGMSVWHKGQKLPDGSDASPYAGCAEGQTPVWAKKPKTNDVE